MKSQFKTLVVDNKDSYLEEENFFTIHPLKLKWLSNFQKETFDNAVIQNVPSSLLTAMGFFHMAQAVRQNGVVEVYVDQPITVMQQLDASEIEANAKLAGFTDVQISDFEKWSREGDRDVRACTVKISMIRPEKVVNDLDSKIKGKK